MKYTRIYKTYADCRPMLVGYACEKGIIRVEYSITLSGNSIPEYYANGWRFSKLKDAKKELESA